MKNKFEHTYKDNPASFLFDIETSKNYKDWHEEHSRSPYATSVSWGIGEQFTHFSFGETSVRIKRKNFTAVDESLSNHTFSFSADQTVSLPTQHLLIALFEYDSVNNYNNTTTNTDSYLLRFDYIIPEIMPKYTLGLGFATTVTDTKAQIETRGTETTLNPSVDLSKEINKNMKISINYDYTKNNSKQSDYKYQKNVFTTEFRYSF